MGRGRLHIAVTIAALALAGCGFADSRSPVVPEFMRIKAADPPPLEAPPDVKRLVGEKLDSVFTAGSHPSLVQVSTPLHDLHGLVWTARVKAELASVMGNPLGLQTHRLTITAAVIADRHRIDDAA